MEEKMRQKIGTPEKSYTDKTCRPRRSELSKRETPNAVNGHGRSPRRVKHKKKGRNSEPRKEKIAKKTWGPQRGFPQEGAKI